VEEFSVLSWLAGVDVDGCAGLVGAGSKEDLQGEGRGQLGHVGLVEPRAAAREWGWGGQGRDRRLLVRGVVASSSGGSCTLRSGTGETDLEEGPGSGSEEGYTGGARKMPLRRDKDRAEKD